MATKAEESRLEPDPTPEATPPTAGTTEPAREHVRAPETVFKGGPYAVSLPKTAAQALRLFDSHAVEPGGPPQTIHLPPGEAGEHQLLGLERQGFNAEPTVPTASKPDPRMTAKS